MQTLRAQALGALILLSLLLSSGCDLTRKEAVDAVNAGLGVIETRGHLSAIPYFEQATEIDPTFALAFHYIGLFRLQYAHNPDQALEPLARAVQLDPDDADFRYQFGIALLQLGYTEQASSEFVHALRIEPNHAEAAWRLGQLAQSGGDLLEAIDRYTQSIHARPDFELPYNSLGNLYLQYGRVPEAIRVFENGVELSADPTVNLADLGRLYVQAEELEVAISYLRRAAEMERPDVSVYYNLGMALRARYLEGNAEQDRQDAERYLQRAQAGCSPQREPARCAALQAVIRELRAVTN